MTLAEQNWNSIQTLRNITAEKNEALKAHHAAKFLAVIQERKFYTIEGNL